MYEEAVTQRRSRKAGSAKPASTYRTRSSPLYVTPSRRFHACDLAQFTASLDDMRNRAEKTGMSMRNFARTALANAWTPSAGEEPPLAAHLVTPRRGYLHHGLYVGHGRVIHYPGLVGCFRRRAVEEVSLEEFARGRPIAVRSDSSPRFDREDVIARARARLGENRYHILRNNCEHFCEWCLSGVSRSPQLESQLARFAAAAIAVMDAVAMWALRMHDQASSAPVQRA
jgi:hypothetical protein